MLHYIEQSYTYMKNVRINTMLIQYLNIVKQNITYVSMLVIICVANCSYRVKHDAVPGPRLGLQLQI